VEKKTCTQTYNKKKEINKKLRLSNKLLNYLTADKQRQSYVVECEQIIAAARNYTYKLHTPLLTISDFTQQIIILLCMV